MPLSKPKPPRLTGETPSTSAQSGAPGTVRVQKRDPAAAPGLREKLCATCGKPFQLTPEQKFFDCPDCYRKSHPPHKSKKRGEAQVLVQIECMQCGTKEFLSFAPTDPKTALCRACFAKQKREQKLASPHSTRR
jgi:DNA-directed RNA polymerase subunit RPC12/RpoP